MLSVHLKLTQCYMAITPQVNTVHQEGTWIFSLKNNKKNCLPEIIYWFFFFFFFLTGPCGMWDLSSQTRDRTSAPALEAESQPLNCQGDPNLLVLREQPWLSICSPVSWWKVHCDITELKYYVTGKGLDKPKKKTQYWIQRQLFSTVVWGLKRLRSKDTDCKAT